MIAVRLPVVLADARGCNFRIGDEYAIRDQVGNKFASEFSPIVGGELALLFDRAVVRSRACSQPARSEVRFRTASHPGRASVHLKTALAAPMIL